jgi:hypothetical protein
MQAVPGPGLGIDEIPLTMAAGWPFLRDRSVLRASVAEARAGGTGSAAITRVDESDGSASVRYVPTP